MYKRNFWVMIMACVLTVGSSTLVKPTDSCDNTAPETSVSLVDSDIVSQGATAVHDAYLDVTESAQDTVDNGRSLLQEWWDSFVIKGQKAAIRTILFALDVKEAFRNKYLAFKHVIRNIASGTKK